MKYPFAAATIALLALIGIAKVAYDIANKEQCIAADSYEFPEINPGATAALSASTRNFADRIGYKFMHSALDGDLTLYGPEDKDRQLIVFNTEEPEKLKISFYDCRKGGNGSAAAEAWMRTIGRRYLKLGAP
jgi:hypothetical protein